ncbi:MAG: hypothetical protein M1582_03395 [Actinobacteria bacterium]|nr:hypothetical protein [Actinomycetota bacterium]
MKLEPAILFLIEIGAFVFFLGLLPLLIVLRNLPGLWRTRRPVAALMVGVVINTAFLFFVLFAAFAGLVTFGGQGQ